MLEPGHVVRSQPGELVHGPDRPTSLRMSAHRQHTEGRESGAHGNRRWRRHPLRGRGGMCVFVSFALAERRPARHSEPIHAAIESMTGTRSLGDVKAEDRSEFDLLLASRAPSPTRQQRASDERAVSDVVPGPADPVAARASLSSPGGNRQGVHGSSQELRPAAGGTPPPTESSRRSSSPRSRAIDPRRDTRRPRSSWRSPS